MAPREHVVITGTGRCGTTFLVELLTRLGLETGINADELESKKLKQACAGLEHDIRAQDCPFIVKSPFFCDYAEEIMRRSDIVVRHIFIPMRDLNAAAESRRYVARVHARNLPILQRLRYAIRPWKFAGGLWRTMSSKPGRQEQKLLEQVYKLMLAIAGVTMPATLMRYARIVMDCRYLFRKLEPVLMDVPYESFCTAFNETVRPHLVHSFNERDC